MHEKISNIVNSSISMTLEPKTHPHKRRPSDLAKIKNMSNIVVLVCII